MSDFKSLWPNGPLYRGESFGTDALALADFAGERSFRRGCDMGCGSGILLLLLAWQNPHAEVDGVELRPVAGEICRDNIAANGWESRCRVTVDDAACCATPAIPYDLVVTNPPYFTGNGSGDADRCAQRTESIPLREWCTAAARLLKFGGDCCAVYPTARLPELINALTAAGLEPKEMRLVAHNPAAAPSLVLCRARKGGKPGLTMRPTLFQTDEQGRETGEYRKICHWEAM